MSASYELVANRLLALIGGKVPEVGIICGSGLSGLSKSLSDPITVPYSDIPEFPDTTVVGHTGELVFGNLNDVYTVCMRGRFHFYEGNSMEAVIFPVRVMRFLGVKLLIVTNAAGGLNKVFNVGDIMIIQDHFGLPAIAGNHPLRGHNDNNIGPRFPSVSDAYDEDLQNLVLSAAQDLNLRDVIRPNGTYCYVSGPMYESRAESRWLRSIGGDSVGMSTIPEVIAAKHCGMKILGLSLITNKVVIEKGEFTPATHKEVLEAVEKSGKNVESIVKKVVCRSNLAGLLASVPEVVRRPAGAKADAKKEDASDGKGLFSNNVAIIGAIGAISLALFAWSRARHV